MEVTPEIRSQNPVGRVSGGFPGLGYQKLLLGAIADVGLRDNHPWSNWRMVEKIGDTR
ncbi:hypothetical protein [Oscillatoria sp. HE19RPO]|uniref:hypothetical protein n=1 Tax=Oscillatoria sp. HE19RPO TaxID=2954806 RepID=UPI0020C49BF3|nr:hypothetical protein [Oscillatoria sp. HE19RPO]